MLLPEVADREAEKRFAPVLYDCLWGFKLYIFIQNVS